MADYKIISRKEAKLLGLKSYFTGVPCKHGHIAPRKVSTGDCSVCKVIRTQVWRNKPEKDKYLNRTTAKELPSQLDLLNMFIYDKDTGKLFWKDRPQKETESKRGYHVWKTLYCNKEAGHVHFANGYVEVRLPSKELHKAHRIIWKIVTGVEPILKIDHINGDTTDNRFSNLRLATDQENARNAITSARSGYKGVNSCGDKFFGAYTINDKNYISEPFTTAEEAAIWYDDQVVELYGEFAKLNFPERFKEVS